MKLSLNRSLVFSLCAVLGHGSAFAANLMDDPDTNYEVKFTNPLCGPHPYDAPVKTFSDGVVDEKPLDVYCNGQNDTKRSGKDRPDSVQSTIEKWVDDASVKDIFFQALSFSNKAVYYAMCRAAARGVDVTYILDAPGGPTGVPSLESNPDCKHEGKSMVKFLRRGHTKGNGSGDAINWAHNKLLMINPKQSGEKTLKIAFGSGNFSSGVVTHHENWHFITAKRSSYFMQSHLCMWQAQLNETSASSRRGYAKAVAECRAATGLQEEDDVKAFFSPGQGQLATRVIEAEIAKSKEIRIGAHRFTYSRLKQALVNRMNKSAKVKIRLVADDDLYWLTVDESQGGGQFGDNGPGEAGNVSYLRDVARNTNQSFEVKYMESNHEIHQLHHNKYLVFDDRAVFTGAGNLTGDAFDNNQPSGNFENFYIVKVPHIVKAFREQYGQVYDGVPSPSAKGWTGKATKASDMPVGNPLPN